MYPFFKAHPHRFGREGLAEQEALPSDPLVRSQSIEAILRSPEATNPPTRLKWRRNRPEDEERVRALTVGKERLEITRHETFHRRKGTTLSH